MVTNKKKSRKKKAGENKRGRRKEEKIWWLLQAWTSRFRFSIGAQVTWNTRLLQYKKFRFWSFVVVTETVHCFQRGRLPLPKPRRHIGQMKAPFHWFLTAVKDGSERSASCPGRLSPGKESPVPSWPTHISNTKYNPARIAFHFTIKVRLWGLILLTGTQLKQTKKIIIHRHVLRSHSSGRLSSYGCQYTSQTHTALQLDSRLFYGLLTFILWTKLKAMALQSPACVI